jgi:hypothetical protein
LRESVLEGFFAACFAAFPADGLAFDGFAFIGNPWSCGRDSRSRKRRTIPSCPGSVKDRPALRFMAIHGPFVRFFVGVVPVTVSFRLSRKGAPS